MKYLKGSVISLVLCWVSFLVFEVCCGGNSFIMYRDGDVELDPETEPDYAAEVFWEAIARQIP